MNHRHADPRPLIPGGRVTFVLLEAMTNALPLHKAYFGCGFWTKTLGDAGSTTSAFLGEDRPKPAKTSSRLQSRPRDLWVTNRGDWFGLPVFIPQSVSLWPWNGDTIFRSRDSRPENQHAIRPPETPGGFVFQGGF